MSGKTNGVVAPITIADALNKTLETPSLDPILLSVANEFLGGTSIPDIATNFSISFRMECAQITLDQATLNQLLRTQTV